MKKAWSVGIVIAAFAAGCGESDFTVGGEELSDDQLYEVDSELVGLSFDMNRLLEDSDLEGDQGVTAEEVQKFLEVKRSFLAGYVDPAFNKRASQLIVEQGRAARISPIYLLARIQTESGLIQSGTSRNLEKATGCGCPDNRPCNGAYAGFGKQVQCGATLLRNYLGQLQQGGATVSGWRVGVPKNTLEPCSVRPANRATAILYTYTPWVGAYGQQCGRKDAGGSSLVAALVSRYRTAQRWSSGGPAAPSAIAQKYTQLGGEGSFLGKPTTVEQATPNTPGAYVHYEKGSIYWSPSSGAWSVRAGIRERWAEVGWERSFLGFPLTDETFTPDRSGTYNHFQGGSIYWSAATGPRIVRGAIRSKWSSLGWERSALRYPATDELTASDGEGRFSNFQGGAIYWTPSIGARALLGPILEKWRALGAEKSVLGYPTSDAGVDGNEGEGTFQRGAILWSAATGAHALHGPIHAAFLGAREQLGLPTSDVVEVAGGFEATFERGSIRLDSATNATTVTVR